MPGESGSVSPNRLVPPCRFAADSAARQRDLARMGDFAENVDHRMVGAKRSSPTRQEKQCQDGECVASRAKRRLDHISRPKSCREPQCHPGRRRPTRTRPTGRIWRRCHSEALHSHDGPVSRVCHQPEPCTPAIERAALKDRQLGTRRKPSGSRTKQSHEPPSLTWYGARSGSMPCSARRASVASRSATPIAMWP